MSSFEEERAEVRRRLAAKVKPVSTGAAPRYDDLYFKGTAWLDRLASPCDLCPNCDVPLYPSSGQKMQCRGCGYLKVCCEGSA